MILLKFSLTGSSAGYNDATQVGTSPSHCDWPRLFLQVIVSMILIMNTVSKRLN